MAEEGASQASEAPLKRKFEEAASLIDHKKFKNCDFSDPAALQNDGIDSFAPPVAEIEPEVLTPDKETLGGFDSAEGKDEEVVVEIEPEVLTPGRETLGDFDSAEGKDEEVVQEGGEEDEEEEEEEEEEDDGEVSSEVDSDEDSEEDSDASSDEETAGISSQNPGKSEEALQPHGSSQGMSSKGKEKEDTKGKGILVHEGKGKAKAKDSDEEVSDENDAGYLSEDPFEEVDLNNILPTRTRRRSSQPVHYDFAEFGDDDDEDDDTDA